MRAFAVLPIAIAVAGCSLFLDESKNRPDAGVAQDAAQDAGVVPSCGKMELLSDEFEGMTDQWFFTQVGGAPQISGGALELSINGDPGDHASATSQLAHDLRGSELVIEFADIPQQVRVETVVRLQSTDGPAGEQTQILLRWTDTAITVSEESLGTVSTHRTLADRGQNTDLVWRFSTSGGRVVVESGDGGREFTQFAIFTPAVDVGAVTTRLTVAVPGGANANSTTGRVESINVPRNPGDYCAVQSLADPFDDAPGEKWAGSIVPGDCTISVDSGRLEITGDTAGQLCSLGSTAGYRFDQGSVGVTFVELSREPDVETRFGLIANEATGTGVRFVFVNGELRGEVQSSDAASNVTATVTIGAAVANLNVRVRIEPSIAVVLEYAEDGSDFKELASAPTNILPVQPFRVRLANLSPGEVMLFDDLNL